MKVIVLCSFLFACAGSSDSGGGGAHPTAAAATGPAATAVTDSASARAAIGKTVRVAGTALNAKLGPVVTTEGLVVYCFGRQEWSNEQLGKPVAVIGVLEQTDDFKAQEGPDGMQSAGTAGGDFLIRDCTVEDP
ncbi:MAG TPA: hypothetical protein VIG06_25470 [Kofleriaceae bacterium]|jgi:hypothetical protein